MKRIRRTLLQNIWTPGTPSTPARPPLLHTFNARMTDIQAQTKPSGGAWDDFHAAFGTHASAPVRPASKTPPEPTPAPARTAQLGMFPKSQVSSPQQFGLAATEGPRPQRNAASPATRKPRVTQPGLFPKSAVSPKKRAGTGLRERRGLALDAQRLRRRAPRHQGQVTPTRFGVTNRAPVPRRIRDSRLAQDAGRGRRRDRLPLLYGPAAPDESLLARG
jgi:hypothetical protein